MVITDQAVTQRQEISPTFSITCGVTGAFLFTLRSAFLVP